MRFIKIQAKFQLRSEIVEYGDRSKQVQYAKYEYKS